MRVTWVTSLPGRLCRCLSAEAAAEPSPILVHGSWGADPREAWEFGGNVGSYGHPYLVPSDHPEAPLPLVSCGPSRWAHGRRPCLPEVQGPCWGPSSPCFWIPRLWIQGAAKPGPLSLWNGNEKEVFPSVVTAQRRWNLQLALSCVPGCFCCCPPLLKSISGGLDRLQPLAHRDTLKSTDLSEHDREERAGEKANHSEPILTGTARGRLSLWEPHSPVHGAAGWVWAAIGEVDAAHLCVGNVSTLPGHRSVVVVVLGTGFHVAQFPQTHYVAENDLALLRLKRGIV